jgi:hypothetical protein
LQLAKLASPELGSCSKPPHLFQQQVYRLGVNHVAHRAFHRPTWPGVNLNRKPLPPPSGSFFSLIVSTPNPGANLLLTISQLLPLVVTLIFLGGLAFVGYQIYVSMVKIQAQAKKQMGNKNVVFTKDGLRVGVKHRETEDYVDSTQSWVVKAWNLGSAKDDTKNKKCVSQPRPA